MQLSFDEAPRSSYDAVPLAVAAWADRVFDWLEQNSVPPEAKRLRFSNGTWAVRATIGDEGWVILWAAVGQQAVIKYLGADTFT